jgi:hypothetical protein
MVTVLPSTPLVGLIDSSTGVEELLPVMHGTMVPLAFAVTHDGGLPPDGAHAVVEEFTPHGDVGAGETVTGTHGRTVLPPLLLLASPLKIQGGLPPVGGFPPPGGQVVVDELMPQGIGSGFRWQEILLPGAMMHGAGKRGMVEVDGKMMGFPTDPQPSKVLSSVRVDLPT